MEALPADVDNRWIACQLWASNEPDDGVFCNSLSTFDKRISISPPIFTYKSRKVSPGGCGKQPLVQISFKMTIGALMTARLCKFAF